MTEDRTLKALKEAVSEMTSRRDLRDAFRSVDDQDWDYIFSKLGDGGRDKFWKTVLSEARAALNIQQRASE